METKTSKITYYILSVLYSVLLVVNVFVPIAVLAAFGIFVFQIISGNFIDAITFAITVVISGVIFGATLLTVGKLFEMSADKMSED